MDSSGQNPHATVFITIENKDENFTGIFIIVDGPVLHGAGQSVGDTD